MGGLNAMDRQTFKRLISERDFELIRIFFRLDGWEIWIHPRDSDALILRDEHDKIILFPSIDDAFCAIRSCGYLFGVFVDSYSHPDDKWDWPMLT
jgi:hypothetical protein